ncbi:unnamed protein product [Ostreobium quekettii]|uniref:Agenet-like domain-containing protein n=1 Tax=Ostreobium quekettii TaxID=121088 RepID=A0A8S1IZB8_9CHLO|nr:unnamed protein product [Ostreobium quekettii]
MAFAPKAGDWVEVTIDGEAHGGSFFSAKILQCRGSDVVVEFIETGPGGVAGRKAIVPARSHNVRPKPPGYANANPVQDRQLGEAVDCWCQGAWRMGHVHEVYDDGVTVFCPSRPEAQSLVTVPAAAHPCAIRTGLDWDAEGGGWLPRDSRSFFGAKVRRGEKLNQGPGCLMAGWGGAGAASERRASWSVEECGEEAAGLVRGVDQGMGGLDGGVASSRSSRASTGFWRREDRDDRGGAGLEEPEALEAGRDVWICQQGRAAMGGNQGGNSKDGTRIWQFAGGGGARPAEGYRSIDACERGGMVHVRAKRQKMEGVADPDTNQPSMKAEELGTEPQPPCPSNQDSFVTGSKVVGDGCLPQTGVLTGNETGESAKDKRNWRKMLHDRGQKELFNGKVIGPKLCIDNLGWVFQDDKIKKDLVAMLDGVEDIEFATGEFDGKRYSAGWACATFKSVEAAVCAMEKLDTMYMEVPCCPIPRPLVPHFPMWEAYPWGRHTDMPGYLDVRGEVSPHFAQKNSIEYRAAIKWRHSDQLTGNVKEQLCQECVDKVCKEVEKLGGNSLDSCKSCSSDVSSGSHSISAQSTLWVKRIPLGISDERLQQAFAQFDANDACKVTRIINPVSQREYGHMVVQFSEPGKAAMMCLDLNKFLFHCGGTPRAVHAAMFKPGPPQGFQGIFDRAMHKALGFDASRCGRGCAARSRVVNFTGSASPSRRCAKAVRDVLNKQLCLVAHFYEQCKDERRRLHVHQQKEFNDAQEMKTELEALCQSPVVKNMAERR